MTPAESMLIGLLKLRGSVQVGDLHRVGSKPVSRQESRPPLWSLVYSKLTVSPTGAFHFTDTKHVLLDGNPTHEEAVVMARRVAKEMGIVFIQEKRTTETVLAALLNDVYDQGESDE